MLKRYELYQLVLFAVVLMGCSNSRKLAAGTDALTTLINDSALLHAHVGILVQDAASRAIIAAHNEHRYFVPASNTKLWTCYAGMKYLGDSLVAGYILRENDSTIVFRSNGDPTFLHPDYSRQPLADALKKYSVVKWQNAAMRTTEYGNGWSWNDYDATYMAPRSSLPMFGNVATFAAMKDGHIAVEPPAVEGLVGNADVFRDTAFTISRPFDDPTFSLKPGKSKKITTTLFLSPAAGARLAATHFGNDWYFELTAAVFKPQPSNALFRAIYSQPTDSMLKPLMHRSDNFFAEQTLLMVSNQWFGWMDERAVIDSLLKTDLSGLPDKPRWVDGSGLSRYNLFSPADYTWLLNKMKNEFPMERIREVLPTGNDGTLTNYYKPLEGKIFAKTGTLAGVVALSGYLYAKSGKLLLFSTLVNNHNGAAPAVRKAVEKYLMSVWENN